MRGVSAALVIVVTVIVLLVVALIVLGIFTRGTTHVSSYFELRGMCQQQGAAMCAASGQLPPTWAVEVQTAEGATSCLKLLNCNDCKTCGFSTPGSTPVTS